MLSNAEKDMLASIKKFGPRAFRYQTTLDKRVLLSLRDKGFVDSRVVAGDNLFFIPEDSK